MTTSSDGDDADSDYGYDDHRRDYYNNNVGAAGAPTGLSVSKKIANPSSSIDSDDHDDDGGDDEEGTYGGRATKKKTENPTSAKTKTRNIVRLSNISSGDIPTAKKQKTMKRTDKLEDDTETEISEDDDNDTKGCAKVTPSPFSGRRSKNNNSEEEDDNEVEDETKKEERVVAPSSSSSSSPAPSPRKVRRPLFLTNRKIDSEQQDDNEVQDETKEEEHVVAPSSSSPAPSPRKVRRPLFLTKRSARIQSRSLDDLYPDEPPQHTNTQSPSIVKKGVLERLCSDSSQLAGHDDGASPISSKGESRCKQHGVLHITRVDHHHHHQQQQLKRSQLSGRKEETSRHRSRSLDNYTCISQRRSGSNSTRSSNGENNRLQQRRGIMDSLAFLPPPPKAAQRSLPTSLSSSSPSSPMPKFRSTPPPLGDTAKYDGNTFQQTEKSDNREDIVDVPLPRPRGRPRKYQPKKNDETADVLDFVPRRGRGRPRKSQQHQIKSSRDPTAVTHLHETNRVDECTRGTGERDKSNGIPSDLLSLFEPPKTESKTKPRSAEQILQDVRVQEETHKKLMERRHRRFTLLRSAARRRGGRKGVYIGKYSDHYPEDDSSRGGASTVSRPWLERTCKSRKPINYNELSDEEDFVEKVVNSEEEDDEYLQVKEEECSPKQAVQRRKRDFGEDRRIPTDNNENDTPQINPTPSPLMVRYDHVGRSNQEERGNDILAGIPNEMSTNARLLQDSRYKATENDGHDMSSIVFSPRNTPRLKRTFASPKKARDSVEKGLPAYEKDPPDTPPAKKRRTRSPKKASVFEGLSNPFAETSQHRLKMQKPEKGKDTEETHQFESSSTSVLVLPSSKQEQGKYIEQRSVMIQASRATERALRYSQQHVAKSIEPPQCDSDLEYKYEDDQIFSRTRPSLVDHDSDNRKRKDCRPKSRSRSSGRNRDERSRSSRNSSIRHRRDDRSRSPSRSPSPPRKASRSRFSDERSTYSRNARPSSRKKQVRFEITRPDGTHIKLKCDAGNNSSSNAAVQAAIAVLTSTSPSNFEYQHSHSMNKKTKENSDDEGKIPQKAENGTSRDGISKLNHRKQSYEEGRMYDEGALITDTRSVVSELTHHWNAEELGNGDGRKLTPREKEEDLSQVDDDDFRATIHDNNNDDTTNDDRVEHTCGDDTRSHIQSHSLSRRKRMWTSMDSLAGSFASVLLRKPANAAGKSNQKVPNQVSIRLKKISAPSSTVHQENTIHAELSVASRNGLGAESKGKTSAVLVSPKSKKGSSTSPSTKNCCGICPGCTQFFDCQICGPCLDRLRSQGMGMCRDDQQPSGCLQRRCYRKRRFSHVDSLMSVASNSSKMTSTKENNENVKKSRSNRQSSVHEDGSESEVNIPKWDNGDVENESREHAAPSILRPEARINKKNLDDSDDWSVDYSYLSEPEYRKRWKRQQDLQRQQLSRSHSVSSLSMFRGGTTGTAASLSTMSASVRATLGSRSCHASAGIFSSLSQHRSVSIARDPSGDQPEKRGPGRPRGSANRKKNQKNPLHDLAFPSSMIVPAAKSRLSLTPGRKKKSAPTKVDGSASVASWHESRKCLRALMEYDEADQDWV